MQVFLQIIIQVSGDEPWLRMAVAVGWDYTCKEDNICIFEYIVFLPVI